VDDPRRTAKAQAKELATVRRDLAAAREALLRVPPARRSGSTC
jgi:hypothetical protein